MKTFIKELLYQISDHMLLGYANFYEYKILKYMRNKLKIHGKILDIGCSSGKFLKHLSKHIESGIGIDIALKMPNSGNISFLNLDASKNLPFKNNYFDCVTCFEVIEHIKNDKNMIKEVKRILKPYGYFILSTPYLPCWKKYTSYKDKIFRKMGHVRLGYELGYFKRLKGFKIIEYRLFNKNRIDQFISIKLFTLLPSFLFYIFLSTFYRFLTIPMYFYDKYSMNLGADIFIVMQKENL